MSEKAISFEKYARIEIDFSSGSHQNSFSPNHPNLQKIREGVYHSYIDKSEYDRQVKLGRIASGFCCPYSGLFGKIDPQYFMGVDCQELLPKNSSPYWLFERFKNLEAICAENENLREFFLNLSKTTQPNDYESLSLDLINHVQSLLLTKISLESIIGDILMREVSIEKISVNSILINFINKLLPIILGSNRLEIERFLSEAKTKIIDGTGNDLLCGDIIEGL